MTQIGEGAFNGCPLEYICLPSSLESIDGNAFGDARFFSGGRLLESTAENLAGRTFEGSGNILRMVEEIEAGERFIAGSLEYTVTSLSPAAVDVTGFSAGVKSAAIPAKVAYGGIAFAVSGVADRAFYGCATLEELSVSAPAVGQKAFANYASLKTVALASVKEIGAYAFFGCPAIASVSFSKDLASVGASAFGKAQLFDGEKGHLRDGQEPRRERVRGG